MDRKTECSARVFLQQYCFRKSLHSIADIWHIPIFDARIPAVWKALEDTDRTVWIKVSSTRHTKGYLPDCPFSSHAREPEPTGYPTLSGRPASASMRRHHPGIEQISSSIEAMPYPIAPPASAAVFPDISCLLSCVPENDLLLRGRFEIFLEFRVILPAGQFTFFQGICELLKSVFFQIYHSGKKFFPGRIYAVGIDFGPCPKQAGKIIPGQNNVFQFFCWRCFNNKSNLS